MAKLPLYNESSFSEHPTVTRSVSARRANRYHRNAYTKMLNEEAKGIIDLSPMSFVTFKSKEEFTKLGLIEGKKPGIIDHNQNYRIYDLVYEKTPLVASAFDTTANFAIQSDFELEAPQESDKNNVNKFLDKVNFKILACNTIIEMQKNGNSFWELVGLDETGNGSVDEVKMLPVESIYVIIEKAEKDNGKILGYAQLIQNQVKAVWTPEQIIHFKWKGNNFYGLSDLSHVMIDITRYENWKDDLGEILHRYAAPIIHWKLGTDEFPASDSDKTSFEAILEDRETGEDIISTGPVESKLVGEGMKMIQLDGLIKNLENNIIAGLKVPEIFVRGGETSNKATADVEMQAFDRRVKAIRTVFTAQIEDKLLPKITRGEIKIVWNEVNLEDETAKSEKFSKLVAGGVPTKTALAMCGWRNWINEYEEDAEEMEAPGEKQPFSKDEKEIVDAQKEQFRYPVVEKLSKETRNKLEEEIDQYGEFLKAKK